MERLTTADIVHLAKLAHLTLSPEEQRRFAQQLSSMLAFVQKLQAVDVASVEGDTDLLGTPLPPAEDIVQETPLRESGSVAFPHKP